MRASLRRSAGVALVIAFALAPVAVGLAVADAPAVDDAYVVNEDEVLTVEAPGVLANDVAANGPVCVVGIDVQGLEGRILDAGNTGWKTDGWFTFHAWSDWNGETAWVYGMKDAENGECIGPALGQGRVTITVRPVNDPPTAVVAGSCEGGVTVEQDSGAYDDPTHCVENHNWGPVDEITQHVIEWVVTTDRPALFAAQPAIGIDASQATFGELHFKPAAGAHGVANVSVQSRDSGGTAHGGNDLSEPVSFKLTITASPESTVTPVTVAPVTDAPASQAPSPATEATAGGDTTGTGAQPTPEATIGDVSGSPTSARGPDATFVVVGLLVALVVVGVAVAPRLARGFKRPS